jgi:hypothetical protein
MVARGKDLFTGDLFEVPRPPPATEGSLSLGLELRHTLNEAIKRCGKSRYELAAKMSELLAQDVTKVQLDSWTAESREGWRFPFEYAPAFETATNTYALLEMLAAKRGARVLVGEEALLAELGKIERQEQELRARKQALRTLVRRSR